MIDNDDGSITLNEEDIRRLNTLIIAAQSSLADKTTFTSEDATQFLRSWNEAHDR